jgi:hypothetical protein
MQLTDCLLVEVALLLIGLTKLSQTKCGFDQPSVKQLPRRLRAQRRSGEQNKNLNKKLWAA